MSVHNKQLSYRGILLSATAVLSCSVPAIAQGAPLGIDEIVTTATKTDVTLAAAPAAMSIINSAELELLAPVNVSDAVRTLPGVSLHGRGVGGRQVLSIRGMESTQTLFMVDGRRTAGSDSLFGHSDFQYNWVPINAIERIEVVRGPLSSLYGSDALGGVVNIITKTAPKEWTGTVSTRYGFGVEDYNESNVSANVSGSLNDQLSVMLSASYDNQEKVALDADPRLSELEGKEVLNAYGRMSFTPSEKHRFILDVSLADEDRVRDTNSRGGPPFYEGSYDLKKLGYGASYEGSYGNIDVSAGYFHSELDQVNSKTHGLSPSSPQTLKDNTFTAHAVIPLFDAHRFVVGGDIRTETMEHPLLPGDGSITYKGLFIQDEWEFSDKFTLTFGARYDDHENFGSEFSPRAYAVYQLSDQLSLKAGYGHGFRAPTLKESLEEYKFVGPHSFYGNPDVGPETSDNFEAGFIYENKRIRLSATGFVNDVQGLIVSECFLNCSARFGRVNTWVNVAETQTKGIESALSIDVGNAFNFALSHTYMDAEDKTSQRKLSERPEHTLQASLSWDLESLGIQSMIRAERLGSVVQYDSSDNVLEVPGYTLWHFNGSWAATDNIKLNYGVRNIGNLSLVEKSENFGYAERGRTVYVGVGVGF